MKQIADIAKALDPSEVPFTSFLPKGKGWTVPDYCAKTKKQMVEPFITYYTEAREILDLAHPPDDEDEDWGTWTPSPAYVRLSKLANTIGQLAYQEVDNPAYDADACLKWKEENAQSWTKVEWGTSHLANITDAEAAAPVLHGDEPPGVGG